MSCDPHVHHALLAVARRDRCGGDSVLAGAGLGDHARLAHAPCDERLPDRVVDLVRAGVVQVFALQIDLRAAEQLGPALRVIDRARPSDVVLELVSELGNELGIRAATRVRVAQLIERVRERLGNEHSAIGTEMPACIGQVNHLHS